MALNLTTFKSDLDDVSDLIDAENGTAAARATMITDILADDDSVAETYRLQQLLTDICSDLGIGPKAQRVADVRL